MSPTGSAIATSSRPASYNAVCRDHASIAITLDTYSHVLPGLKAAAAEALDTIFAEGGVENRVSNL
jgi:hypothetical protein